MELPEAPWAVAPNFPPDAFRRFDTVERQAVLLPVRLVRAKKEPDGDVQLIGLAPTDQSVELVVEFPSVAAGVFCTTHTLVALPAPGEDRCRLFTAS